MTPLDPSKLKASKRIFGTGESYWMYECPRDSQLCLVVTEGKRKESYHEVQYTREGAEGLFVCQFVHKYLRTRRKWR